MYSDSFERIGARRGVWDVSRDCEDPVPVVLHSRATGDVKRFFRSGQRTPPGMELVLLTACRRCRVCLRKKSRLWFFRAKNEIADAPRTWFGTLTCSPENHYRLDELASSRKRDFWKSSPGKKFETQSVVLASEITKYLKRLRKMAGTRFRYLLVLETHDSAKTSPEMKGRLHAHLLIHEISGQLPITKAILDQQWRLGFTKWKLADQEAAAYVSKYITKALDCRVRASLDYGNSQARYEMREI